MRGRWPVTSERRTTSAESWPHLVGVTEPSRCSNATTRSPTVPCHAGRFIVLASTRPHPTTHRATRTSWFGLTYSSEAQSNLGRTLLAGALTGEVHILDVTVGGERRTREQTAVDGNDDPRHPSRFIAGEIHRAPRDIPRRALGP